MVKYHTEESCYRHMGYSFRLAAMVPTDRIAHTTAFVTPVVVHWLEREIQNVQIIKTFWCSLLILVCDNNNIR